MVSQMAALDGLSFSAIAGSSTLRLLYEKATGARLPVSPHTVREMILKFAEDKKVIITSELKKLKLSGSKFTVTLDEWTSAANRRYLNMNLHTSSKFWNLGLIRIFGSFSSEACLEAFRSRLSEFGLSTEDVFAVVSDGASVMVRFGRLSGCYHQLCLAHGIHLAVCHVLYEGNGTLSASQSDNSSDEDSDDEESLHSAFTNQRENDITYGRDIKSTIDKIRNVVKMFRKSPLKSEILNKYAENTSSHGLKLILDTKTRWNSALDMLQRICIMKDPLQRTLVELNEPFHITEAEFDLIQAIVDILQPIKLTVDVLCRRETNLIATDAAINFMLEKLALNHTVLGEKMFETMKERILERRTTLSDVASYLHYGSDQVPDQAFSFYPNGSRQNLIQKISEVFKKSPLSMAEPETSEADSPEESESLLCELSLEKQLQIAVDRAKCYAVCPPLSNFRDLNAKIRREMQIFEATGNRGTILNHVHSLVMTIRPSSVEAERVFSAANSFCTKTRSKLKDASLNALVFLKWFFKTN